MKSFDNYKTMNTHSETTPLFGRASDQKNFLSTYGYLMMLSVGVVTLSGSMPVIVRYIYATFDSVLAVTFVELVFAALVTSLLGRFGFVQLDRMDQAKVKVYAPAAATFYVTLVASNKVIQLSGVYAFIMVRCTGPIVTSFLEYAVLPHQSTMTAHSVISLMLVLSGGVLYATHHIGDIMPGLDWMVMYVICMPIHNIITKRVLNKVDLHPWNFVLYQSVLACVIMPFVALATGQFEVFDPRTYITLFSSPTTLPIIIACVAALFLAFCDLNAQNMITATAFTVLGCLAKFLTIGLSAIVLESRHQPALGIVGIVVSLFSCCAWQWSVGKNSLTDKTLNQDAEGDTPRNSNNSTKQFEEETSARNAVKVMFDHPYTVCMVLYIAVAVQHVARWSYAHFP